MDYIRQFSLEDHLNEDLLRRLRQVKFASNRDVFDEQYLYFLVEGRADVSYQHLNGKRSVVAILTPLAMIGELDLFYTPDLMLSIITTEPSTFLIIERDLALRYGADHPPFLRLIIHNLSVKLRDTTMILRQNVLPLIAQVAAHLLNQTPDQHGWIDFISKNYLSGLMGTTNRHLNRVFKTLLDEQVIIVKSHSLMVMNKPALIRYRDGTNVLPDV